MPLLYLKLFGAASIVAVVVGVYWYIDNRGYVRGEIAGKAEVQVRFDKLQTEYNNYKESINDQVQKAIIEKTKLEAIQNAKHAQAKIDYMESQRKLRAALEQLRNSTNMQGGVTLPLANMRPSSMPSQAANTSEFAVATRTFPGSCSFEFYAAAMRDNLQCKTLIDFVSKHE